MRRSPSAWRRLAGSGYEDFGAMARRCEEEAAEVPGTRPRARRITLGDGGCPHLLDRFDAALNEAETAVRINPNLSEAYITLGLLDSIVRTAPRGPSDVQEGARPRPSLRQGRARLLASAATTPATTSLPGPSWRGCGSSVRSSRGSTSRIADYHMARREFDEAQKMVDVARSLEPDDPIGRRVAGSALRLLGEQGRRPKPSWRRIAGV